MNGFLISCEPENLRGEGDLFFQRSFLSHLSEESAQELVTTCRAEKLSIFLYCQVFCDCSITGQSLIIRNKTFQSPCFLQVKTEDLLEVWVFFIRPFFRSVKKNSILYETAFDCYVNSQVAAAEKWARKRLEEDKHYHLNRMSPGLLGMNMDKISTCLALLDPPAIVINDQSLLPQKAICGLWIAAKKNYSWDALSCQYCTEEKKNCSYCFVAQERGKKNADTSPYS